MTINRKFDVVSPKLMKWLSTGESAEVKLHHCTMDGIVLFGLTLLDARLKNYSTTEQSTDGEIPETLTVLWQGFVIDIVETGKDGKRLA
jgi:type VI protein secretion system component Hcp